MRYSLISCTTHPTKGWLASFANIALDIVSPYRLFLGTTYQSLGGSFQITFPHPFPCVVLILVLHISSKLSMHSFCSPFIFLCSSLVFLNSLGSPVSLCVIVLFVLIATSNGSMLFLTYHHRPFSSLFTLFSHSIGPRLPFFLEKYNYATSLLDYSVSFIVITFLVFLSISCSSFLFNLTIPAPNLKIKTAQMLSAIILFLSKSILPSWDTHSWTYLSFLVVLHCHTPIYPGFC